MSTQVEKVAPSPKQDTQPEIRKP